MEAHNVIATKTTNGSGPANGAADIVLEIKNLKTHFHTEDGVVKAVDGVDFFVKRGEVLGLVGESGCGKSVTCFSILRLVGSPGKILDGEVIFEGRDLLKLAERDMVKVRGDRIAMIFQQPQSSLNPVFKGCSSRWVSSHCGCTAAIGRSIAPTRIWHSSTNRWSNASRSARMN